MASLVCTTNSKLITPSLHGSLDPLMHTGIHVGIYSAAMSHIGSLQVMLFLEN